MSVDTKSLDVLKLAERVRTACIEAALAGYEDAALSGLCHEGAWEAAISAMERLELSSLINSHDSTNI